MNANTTQFLLNLRCVNRLFGAHYLIFIQKVSRITYFYPTVLSFIHRNFKGINMSAQRQTRKFPFSRSIYLVVQRICPFIYQHDMNIFLTGVVNIHPFLQYTLLYCIVHSRNSFAPGENIQGRSLCRCQDDKRDVEYRNTFFFPFKRKSRRAFKYGSVYLVPLIVQMPVTEIRQMYER